MKAPPKRCPHCAQNPAGMAVCPACGRKLVPPQVNPPPAPPPMAASRAVPPVRKAVAPEVIEPPPEFPEAIAAPESDEAIDDWLPPVYDFPTVVEDSPSIASPRTQAPVIGPPAALAPDQPELTAHPWARWQAERSGERGRLEKNALLLVVGLATLLVLVVLLRWI
jgi:hypothetical protein